MKTMLCLLIMISAGAASACSCTNFMTPSEQFGACDAVFTGNVIDIVSSDTHDYVTMRVHAYWKGTFGPTVLIKTELDSAACGVDFTPGIVWLVYATETTGLGDYYTHSCTRTWDVQDCQDDLDYLGDPLVVPNAPGTWGGIKAIYR